MSYNPDKWTPEWAEKMRETQADISGNSQVPALRQSTQEVMSCPRFYVETFIKGNKSPSGIDSARGTEVHRTMALYLSHCTQKQVPSDLEAFDQFSRGAGPQAAKILTGLRDSFTVDYEHLLATEVQMFLDEDFRPTNISPELGETAHDSGKPAAYEGTLDGLYLFPQEVTIQNDDFKSHVRPFDPEDKPQGKQYAVFIFQHFPWVMKVRFRLIFVRYRNLVREVTYDRSDLPVLIDALRSARARQMVLHENHAAGADIEAIPGAQCQYCPLLANRSCPIAEFNYEMQLTPEDRVKFLLWYSAFNRVNSGVLKDYVNASGRNVILRDYNGKIYKYGPVESESKTYPLFKQSAQGGIVRDHHGTPILPIIDLLLDYIASAPDDTEWLPKLSISGTKLNSYLKAKSRVNIHQSITDEANKITKVSLKVSKPLDVLEEEDDEQDDDNEFDDGEF